MAISARKRDLMIKAKEKGINVTEDMSIFEIERLLNDSDPKKEPEKQPSKRRGEY